MILVLLTRFSESDEAIVGFTLCQKLAAQGYPLYVTTTSTDEVLQQERKKADQISKTAKGSVTLLQPQYKDDKIPAVEWIVTHHEEYFSFLSNLSDIQAVIGLLPGTEKSAVELKEALDCKLVLLASTEIPEQVYERRLTDLNKVAEIADEIWVFGSEIHYFYSALFKNVGATLCEKLKELSPQPFLERFIKKTSFSMKDETCDPLNSEHIISLWRRSHKSFMFREEVHTKRNDDESFLTLCSSLKHLSLESKKIQWKIYDIKSEDETNIEDKEKTNLNFPPFTKVSSQSEFSWKGCSAFIVPDAKDAEFNFQALNAIANGIPSLVSSQSAIGKFIQQLNCAEKTKALVDLRGNIDIDKDIWIDKIRKEILDEEANPRQWAKEIKKDIKKSFQAWNKSILVLLHKFNEAKESCLGFQLCQKLVKEGHHLLVSTTASGDELKAEIQKAKQLTDHSPGSITLLQPQYGEREKPSVEWIEHPKSKYFWHLSQLQNIQMIIGNLPGTSQTAVALKHELNCKLILLATTNIGSENENLKEEICKLATCADEIWSVGSDTYNHYRDILLGKRNNFSEKHKEILFKPIIDSIPRWEQKNEVLRQKIISSWNPKVQFYLDGKRMFSKGSDIKAFATLNAALRNVAQSDTMKYGTAQWHWDIHVFKPSLSTFRSLENYEQPSTFDVTALDGVTSVESVDWENCLAFIVPDDEEETFNFLALTAIWLGIPTLASRQSSIGKFLQSLSCPTASNGLVHLMDSAYHDVDAWTNKIKEVLDQDTKPTEWTRQLTQHLQRNNDLWELNLPIPKKNPKRWLSPSLNASLFTKKDGQINRSEVLDEVAKELERVDVDGNNVDSNVSSIGFQISSSGNVSTKTAASVSSVSDFEYPMQDYEFGPCGHHPDYHQDKFCKTCNQCICNAIKHRGHDIIPLNQKVKDEQRRLEVFLDAGRKDVLEANKRITETSSVLDSVESSTSEAIKKMTSQLEYVKGELDEIFRIQVEEIKSRKSKDIHKLEDRTRQLQQFVENWKDIEQKGETILKEGGSSSFVSDVENFLDASQIEQLFPEKQIRKILFTEPIYKKTVQTEDREIFRTFLREHVIGLFVRRPRDNVPSSEPRAVLISYTDVKNNESPLRTFSSALLKGDSLWICGWIKGRLWYNTYLALFEVQIPEYNFLLKHRIKDSSVEKPIMCASGDRFLFAKKGGLEVYSYDTQTQQTSALKPGNVAVIAMCGNLDYVFILDNSRQRKINIFDSEFNPHGNISTGLDDANGSDFDMCILKDTFNTAQINVFPHDRDAHCVVILSTSIPQASVKAIRPIEGILWQLDSRSRPELGLHFDPCSVSASKTGDIFIADRGSEQVSKFD